MWKVLILVMVIAVPIFCGPIDGEEPTPFAMIEENLWKDVSKNATGVDINYETHRRLYSKYENCIKNAIDEEELKREMELQSSTENFTISSEKRYALMALSRKYCPKMKTYIGCNDILMPMENECFNVDGLTGRRVGSEIVDRFIDFFCKNESEPGISFIGGNVVQCGMKNNEQSLGCSKGFDLSFVFVNKKILSHQSKAANLCNNTIEAIVCRSSVENCMCQPLRPKILETVFCTNQRYNFETNCTLPE